MLYQYLVQNKDIICDDNEKFSLQKETTMSISPVFVKKIPLVLLQQNIILSCFFRNGRCILFQVQLSVWRRKNTCAICKLCNEY